MLTTQNLPLSSRQTDTQNDNSSAFNFDLARMQKAVESDYFPVPKFDSVEELAAWLESQL